jgi:hypothetical protein
MRHMPAEIATLRFALTSGWESMATNSGAS